MDKVIFYMGEVVGIGLIPLVLGCLTVLFKRFRTRAKFLQVSLLSLVAVGVIFAYGSNQLKNSEALLDAWVLKALCVIGILLAVAYAKDMLIWLKREIF